MNSKIIKSLILIGAVLVLGAVNFAIFGKERIKRDGEVLYLSLAPVDPRSLMQGDYMALRFALAQQIESASQKGDEAAREGEVRYADVTIDASRIATLAAPSAGGSLKLRYRIREGRVWLGTNAFFFEEGTADRFSHARYGEFRVDTKTGEAVLVGLRGEKLEAL
jgi:uncharacterized membrane-anchored protein